MATVVALLAVLVASTDAARALSALWLIAVFGALYGVSAGVAIGLLYRRMGVVTFQRPCLVPTVALVTACVAVCAGTYVVCTLASCPVRGIPAGAGAGCVLAIGMTVLNRKVARDALQWPP